MIRNRILMPALALTIPLAFGACADVDDDAGELDVDTLGTTQEPMGGDMQPSTTAMTALGGSGITGEAITTRYQDSVTVRLSLEGLEDGEDYSARIVQGMCAMDQAGAQTEPGGQTEPGDQTGQEGQSIADVDLQVSGTSAMSQTSVSASQLQTGMASIQVMGPDDQIVACGDIRTGTGGMGTGGGMGADAPGTGGGAGTGTY